MSALKNPRHERFAQALAASNGEGATDAYLTEYPESNPDSARSAASRLLARVNIRYRVDELMGKGAERAEVDTAKVMQGFADIAFVDIGDIVRWDAEGHVFLTESTQLTRSQRNAVKKVTHTKRTIPQKNAEPIVEETVALELESRKAALDSLGKVLGMFKERVDINLVHSLAESMGLSPEEVMREAEAIIRGKVTT